jgi:hypothetical protein
MRLSLPPANSRESSFDLGGYEPFRFDGPPVAVATFQ